MGTCREHLMAEGYFELLGLAVEPVAPERLKEVYEQARETWFFRQFQPEYLLEARGELEKIDEAYRALKDPRRQAGLLRQARAAARARPTQVIHEGRAQETIALPAATRPLVNRPKLARQLLQDAEARRADHGTLTDNDKRALTRIAFDAGLLYTDAEEFVSRVVEQIESVDLKQRKA